MAEVFHRKDGGVSPRQLVASTCSFRKSTHIFFTGSIWYWLAAFSRDWTLLLFTEILRSHHNTNGTKFYRAVTHINVCVRYALGTAFVSPCRVDKLHQQLDDLWFCSSKLHLMIRGLHHTGCTHTSIRITCATPWATGNICLIS